MYVRTGCTDPPDGYKEETAGKGIWRKGSEGREGKLGSKNTISNVYASVYVVVWIMYMYMYV